MNGSSDTLEDLFGGSEFNQPHAQHWEGHCHQWSATSLHPEIASLLSGTQGILCGGIVLTLGEIKELMTALFPEPNSLKHLASGENFNPRNPVERQLRLTVDDFLGTSIHANPIDIDRNIREGIRLGYGAIVDKSSSEEVWNQPVYEIETHRRELDLTDPDAQLSATQAEALFQKIPASLFEAETASERELLDHLVLLQNKIESWVHKVRRRPQNAQNFLSDILPELTELERSMGLTAADRPPSDRLNEWAQAALERRSQFYSTFLLPRFRRGSVRLKPGWKIEVAETTLHYADEVAFASRENANAELRYKYLIFTGPDPRYPLYSWITPPSGRIDLVRVTAPESLTLPKLDDARSRALADLLTLIKTCTNLQSVVQFYGELSTSLQDGQLEPTELESFRVRFTEVKAVIDRKILREYLSDKLPPSSIEQLESLIKN